MIDAPVQNGEAVIESWGVSWRSYVIRCAIIAAIWTVFSVFGNLGSILNVYLIVPGSVLVTLFYMWVFGELDLWWHNRRTHWHLTNRAIHVVADDEPPLRLPLESIRKINRWPLWSLVLRLTNGTAITLPLVPQPSRLRRRILSARTAALPEGAP